jgi:hypothetical protein
VKEEKVAQKIRSVLPIPITMAVMMTLLQIMADNSAFAMGDPPTTRRNVYASKIILMQITADHKNYYPMINKNLTFTAHLNQGYDVITIIQAAKVSNSKNVGSVWYHQDAVGYASGRCVDNVHHNQYIIIKSHFNGQPSWMQYDRLISWETLGKTTSTNPYVFVAGPTYRVHWVY